MELSDYHQWWKHQGGQELRRLLMEHWDPIGVKGSAEAADEYDGYRGGLIQLLRDGASAEMLAEHLADVERQSMGFNTPPRRLLPLGDRIARWYPDSLARWETSGGFAGRPRYDESAHPQGADGESERDE